MLDEAAVCATSGLPMPRMPAAMHAFTAQKKKAPRQFESYKSTINHTNDNVSHMGTQSIVAHNISSLLGGIRKFGFHRYGEGRDRYETWSHRV